MSKNPYAAPNAELEPEPDIPETVIKKIRNAWIAGLVSTVFTVIMIFISLFVTNMMGLNAWSLIDVAIMAALTFGIYKNSRVSAILMFSFFALNKILMWAETGSLSGLPLALIFFWFFAQGIAGTFQLHKLKKSRDGNV